ncbi:regulatory protein RecX [bacterium]|nr:regulatory protein RecX [bacterium]
MNEQPTKDIQKCRNTAYRLLSRRDHSERELEKKLGRRFEPETIAAVLENLRVQDLVNDRRFAKSFARQLLAKGPCGEGLIRRKLAGRGVAPAIIDQTLDELNINEEELGRLAAQLKLPSLIGLDRETAVRRLLSHLERRGFPRWIARSSTLRTLEDWPSEREEKNQ